LKLEIKGAGCNLQVAYPLATVDIDQVHTLKFIYAMVRKTHTNVLANNGIYVDDA